MGKMIEVTGKDGIKIGIEIDSIIGYGSHGTGKDEHYYIVVKDKGKIETVESNEQVKEMVKRA